MPRSKRIFVDTTSPTPIYRQVADQIRMLLVAKQFAPGERLPTVRRLAVDLAVNHNTVAEAYRILAQEGWLRLARGRGALVLPRGTPEPEPQTRARFVQRLRELIAQGQAAGVPTKAIRSELESMTHALTDRIKTKGA